MLNENRTSTAEHIVFSRCIEFPSSGALEEVNITGKGNAGDAKYVT
jgi:hypothetical protein